MRLLLPCVVLFSVGVAEGRPLVLLEARLGGGVALGGGGGVTAWKAAPITIGALGELTVRETPWLTIYGGAYVETLGRAAAGLAVGGRIRPWVDGGTRLGLGITGTIAPYTIGGATASAGWCWQWRGRRGFRVCGDLEADALFLGGDLPSDRVVVQLRAVLAGGLDAW